MLKHVFFQFISGQGKQKHHCDFALKRKQSKWFLLFSLTIFFYNLHQIFGKKYCFSSGQKFHVGMATITRLQESPPFSANDGTASLNFFFFDANNNIYKNYTVYMERECPLCCWILCIGSYSDTILSYECVHSAWNKQISTPKILTSKRKNIHIQ